MDEALDLVLLSVASGTLALTLTYSHITKPIRRAMLDAPFMLGELFSCPYCIAHWTAMPAAYAMGGNIGTMFTHWLIVTGLSSLFAGILLRLFLFREAENEELRELLREASDALQAKLETEEKS